MVHFTSCVAVRLSSGLSTMPLHRSQPSLVKANCLVTGSMGSLKLMSPPVTSYPPLSCSDPLPSIDILRLPPPRSVTWSSAAVGRKTLTCVLGLMRSCRLTSMLLSSCGGGGKAPISANESIFISISANDTNSTRSVSWLLLANASSS